MSEETKEKSPSLWQVAHSVLSALFSVQTVANYERDFSYGKPSQYIILGVIGVFLFIGTIIGLVNLVIVLST